MATIPERARRLLLRIARDSLDAHLGGRATPRADPARLDVDEATREALEALCGAFVTLHAEGRLRGCIGYMQAERPLWRSVRELVVSSATRDTRFDPVRAEEVAGIDIEVSALTPLQAITSADQVEVGQHGLVVRREGRSGLLLPQVATSYGWDRETFLEQTCHKAGLPRDAWREGAEILVFRAEVWGENELGIGGGLPPLPED